MVPHVLADKMFTSGLNCLKKDREVLRMKTGLGKIEVRSHEVIKSVNDLIQSNRTVTVDDIAKAFSLSVGQYTKLSMMTLATQKLAAGGCQRCLQQSTEKG